MKEYKKTQLIKWLNWLEVEEGHKIKYINLSTLHLMSTMKSGRAISCMKKYNIIYKKGFMKDIDKNTDFPESKIYYVNY